MCVLILYNGMECGEKRFSQPRRGIHQASSLVAESKSGGEDNRSSKGKPSGETRHRYLHSRNAQAGALLFHSYLSHFFPLIFPLPSQRLHIYSEYGIQKMSATTTTTIRLERASGSLLSSRYTTTERKFATYFTI